MINNRPLYEGLASRNQHGQKPEQAIPAITEPRY